MAAAVPPTFFEPDRDDLAVVRGERDELGRTATTKRLRGRIVATAWDQASHLLGARGEDVKEPVRAPRNLGCLSSCDSCRESGTEDAVGARRDKEPKRRTVEPERYGAITGLAGGGGRRRELPESLDGVSLLRQRVGGRARIPVAEKSRLSGNDSCEPRRRPGKAANTKRDAGVRATTARGQAGADKKREHAGNASHPTVIRQCRPLLSRREGTRSPEPVLGNVTRRRLVRGRPAQHWSSVPRSLPRSQM